MISEINSEVENKKIKLSSKQIWLTVISGVIASVSGSVVQLDWVMWFALIPFFYSLYRYPINGKTGFKLSFTFSLVYYLGLLKWLFKLYPLTFVGFSNPVSFILITAGWFTFSLIESLWLSLFGYVIGKIKTVGIGNYLLPISMWILIEWLQGQGEPGFTWGRLAISQYKNLHLIQSSNLFGSLFISALIIMVNITLTFLLINYQKSKENNTKLSFKPLITIILIMIINFGYGFYSLSSRIDNGKEINASIAQANILSAEKWNMKPTDIAKVYLDLSYKDAQDKSKPKTDLMLWPESAIPVAFMDNKIPVDPQILTDMKEYILKTNTYLFTGIFTIKPLSLGHFNIYNSIIGFDNTGKFLGAYSKRHLVPFGEYLPFRSLLEVVAPSLAHMNALDHDITPGEDTGIINTPFGRIGSLVCYDSIFPQLIRQSVNDGAELLILSTNDSWYKDSSGVYQHNAQSVFRAVENDRYMVRAANTGVSSIIAPDGEIMELLPPLVKGTISGKVRFRNTLTLYSQIGDVIAILALACLIFIIFFRKKDYEIVSK